MGLVSDKENPFQTLEKLNKSKLINCSLFKTASFSFIKAIIEEYDSLATSIKNQSKGDDNSTTSTISSLDLSKNKQKLNRIKKWIKMAQTKLDIKHKTEKARDSISINNLDIKNNFSNESQREQNANLKEIETHKSPNIFNNSNCLPLSDLSFDNDLNDINKGDKNYINWMYKYTNIEIEKGLYNFFTIKRCKFINRVFKGPPNSFRIPSWVIMNNILNKRKIDIYNYYLSLQLNEETKLSILRDISRTFPSDEFESNEKTKHENSLLNILISFANLDRELSYCQGMNLIAGFLLIINDFVELNSFYFLLSLFSNNDKTRQINVNQFNFPIRGFFSEGFPLLWFFNFVFDQIMEENLPQLKNHLQSLDIPYDLWIGKWFQTLFTIVLSIDDCKRLWDCILVKGICFMLNFSLVFTKEIQNDLFAFKEELEVQAYFNEMEKMPLSKRKENCKGNIEILLKKAGKINLNIKYYYDKYIKEKCVDFKEQMIKNFIAFTLTKEIISTINDNNKIKTVGLNERRKSQELTNNNLDFIYENKINYPLCCHLSSKENECNMSNSDDSEDNSVSGEQKDKEDSSFCNIDEFNEEEEKLYSEKMNFKIGNFDCQAAKFHSKINEIKNSLDSPDKNSHTNKPRSTTVSKHNIKNRNYKNLIKAKGFVIMHYQSNQSNKKKKKNI